VSTSRFPAALLRASAEGYAGLAAGRLIECDPALAVSGGFETWRAHLRSQLAALAAAVEDGAPELFAAQVGWTRDAYLARARSVAVLRGALSRLREVLEESLPAPAWAELPTYFERAMGELSLSPALEASALPGAHAHGPLALEYVSALVAGDEQRAVALVLDALGAGQLGVREALDSVLVPAQRELGRLWHQGVIGVAEEHFGSVVTGKVLARAMTHAPPLETNGSTVIVASVAGDSHDLGVRMVAAFFELDGWRSICLGGNTPLEDLVEFVARFDGDLVALGATLGAQREVAARTVEALRAARPGQRVLVGGAAFGGDPALWRRVGADGYASSAAEAVEVGRRLVRA
jgi:MerR family transcriptional regulator, light-induced transcriptional regulator